MGQEAGQNFGYDGRIYRRTNEYRSAFTTPGAWRSAATSCDEADGHANTKTQKRTEGAATAVQVMRGDSFSARWVEPGSNTKSTSFGVKAELLAPPCRDDVVVESGDAALKSYLPPLEMHSSTVAGGLVPTGKVKAESPALPCRDDVVVESGDAALKSCLPSLEMRSSTVAGGLVPTGEASTPTDTSSTVTETSFNQPPLRFYTIEETDLEANSKETNLRTSTPQASYDGSVFQESNLSAALCCRRVVETKSGQNRTFDPGGSQGHLFACTFLGSWRALVWGKVVRAGGKRLQQFFKGSMIRDSKVFRRAVRAKFYAVRIVFSQRRFTDSLKNGQPRIRCAGKSLVVEGGSRLHESEERRSRRR